MARRRFGRAAAAAGLALAAFVAAAGGRLHWAAVAPGAATPPAPKPPAGVAAAEAPVSPVLVDERPVVAVLGAGGRTGALVVEALRKAGARPRALTRSGTWSGSKGAADVEVGQADVTDFASLAAALAGASAVVFAAAYSRGKTLPKDIDNAGLVNTAKAVKEAGIGRLVVVSSAATTRPYAPVGVLLNTIGSGVLLEKLKGESEMKGILRDSGSTYTIVKPGGLKTGDAVGFAELEFNQGDTFVGSVQRADVAAVCAAAALDEDNRAANKTFEMYEAKSRNGLLPWYSDTKYVVDGSKDCGEMIAALRDDADVTDVPGFLPF